MRTTSLVLLSLASASSLVAAKPAEGGSIEALLDRVAQRSNRSAPAKPSDTPVVVKDGVKPAPAVEKADLSVEEDDGRESSLSAFKRSKLNLRYNSSQQARQALPCPEAREDGEEVGMGDKHHPGRRYERSSRR
jgi:hypothetical protein